MYKKKSRFVLGDYVRAVARTIGGWKGFGFVIGIYQGYVEIVKEGFEISQEPWDHKAIFTPEHLRKVRKDNRTSQEKQAFYQMAMKLLEE